MCPVDGNRLAPITWELNVTGEMWVYYKVHLCLTLQGLQAQCHVCKKISLRFIFISTTPTQNKCLSTK